MHAPDDPVIAALGRPIRLGLAGGGPGSMIGPVHRRAATLDGRFEIVAGAVSADPARAVAAGRAIGLPRPYASAAEMLAREAGRPDGIEALAVMTPNDSHAALIRAAAAHGLDVICDKPLTSTGAEAEAVARAVAEAGVVLCLTHAYAGYPMLLQARALVAEGALGALRLVQVDYLGAGLAARVEDTPEGARRWRLDPARSGASLVLLDLGTHAHHLAGFVAGRPVAAVRAEVGTLVPGRRVHDYAEIALRFAGGARGRLSLCQAATGQPNTLTLRVIGERASLEWRHDAHETLILRPLDGPAQIHLKGAPWLSPAARRATRFPRTGHPEALHGAFANIYADAAELIAARRTGRTPDPLAAEVPGLKEGLRGVWFAEAALASDARGHAWVDCRLE